MLYLVCIFIRMQYAHTNLLVFFFFLRIFILKKYFKNTHTQRQRERERERERERASVGVGAPGQLGQISPLASVSRCPVCPGSDGHSQSGTGRSVSYGRLNGVIVEFGHGLPGYDHGQNSTLIRGQTIHAKKSLSLSLSLSFSVTY